jgi:hypothetical protein
MPLADTPFNACKSDLKYIEAASHQAVALASHVVYSNVIEDGRTGLLFRTPKDLERNLTLLVSNPKLGLSLGKAARDYVRDHRMLNYQLSKRTSWYHSLWERRHLLTKMLLDRVPEL